MHLPVNIEAILRGKVVESERVEFKKGWNPEAILHSLCAFANDFHNLGGGYIFIGVEARDGRPILPPAGVNPDALDRIQKEIIAIGYRIQPDYHPVVSPYEIQGRQILVLWAYGGQTRPYKAPVSLAKDCREYAWFIRKSSATVKARGHDERELLSLSATVPFDDRIRQDASPDDLDLSLIRTFLREIGSDLYKGSGRMDFTTLCRQMNVVAGPDEFLRPLNVGLLFFNEQPDKFFPYTQIDVVQFPDGRGGDQFTEKIFKGPVDRMVKDALNYINGVLIEEIVIKHPGRAEAERLFNYPFEAIEEALVNAVYHRGYDIREPVEVQILPDEVIITSQPGPDRSIRASDLKKDHFVSRRYRNRRIGEFLKELDLAEGRGTGIPKILRAIRRNKSPRPTFETDDDRTYFAARFPIHPKAKKKTQPTAPVAASVTAPVTPQVASNFGTKSGLSRDQVAILQKCITDRQIGYLMALTGRSNRTKFRDQVLKPLIANGLVEMTIPDKPTSRFQKYRLTEKGQALLKSVNKS
ncbi:MAG: putative DNA binding domain-containing protein [Kiritimatiellaeota bacterium]|nr:putative DNA binding domain-containing protein [Kiritimatiellota bacterium]